jgi:hypothetical protein
MQQCQSCGMPLRTRRAGDCRGSDSDGSKSEKWCSLCYSDGRFTNPDCTVEEMVRIVDSALRGKRMWFPMRWVALRQIPTLERWR